MKSVIHESGTRIYQSFLEVSLFRPLPQAMTSPPGARAARRTLPGNREGVLSADSQWEASLDGDESPAPGDWLDQPVRPQAHSGNLSPAHPPAGLVSFSSAQTGVRALSPLGSTEPARHCNPVRSLQGHREDSKTQLELEKKQTHHLRSAPREQQQAQAARALCPSIKSHRPLQRAGRGKTEHEMEHGNRAGKRRVETSPPSLPQPKPSTVNTNSLRLLSRSFHVPQLAKLKKGF